jgi:hypothetical protein
MPIQFKSKLSSTIANQTFLDKTINDLKKGKLGLYKVDTLETGYIDDVQNFINEIASTSGISGEGDSLSKTYSSEEIIANGDDRKEAIGKLDAQVKLNVDAIADHEIRITNNRTDIDDHETRITDNEAAILAIQDDYGVANGLATLDISGKVPSSQLPSYVDDVLEYADLATFPLTGETGKIYVALDNGKTYRWSGSAYVEISPSEVNSVNGKIGLVVLDKTDIGLSDVTNDSQLKRSAADIDSFTEKLTPINDDLFLIEDSADSFNKKKVKLSNMVPNGANPTLSNLSAPTAINEDLIANKLDFNLKTKDETALNSSAISILSGTGDNTGNVTIASGIPDTFLSGTLTAKSGDATFGGGQSGGVNISSGDGGISGAVTIKSGQSSDAVQSGTINISTGGGQDSGTVTIKSGDASVGPSGNIDLIAGSSPTNQGVVNIQASSINVGNAPIKDVAEPSDPQDSATKNYVDTLVSTQASSLISALDIDWSLSSVFFKDIAVASTFTFSNADDGKVISVTLTNSTGGDLAISLPAGIKSKALSLSIPASSTNVYTFIVSNGITYATEIEGMV